MPLEYFMEERFSLTPWDLCHEDQFLGAAQTRRCRQPPVNGEQQPDVGKAAYGSTPYPPERPVPPTSSFVPPLNRKKKKKKKPNKDMVFQPNSVSGFFENSSF